MSLLGRLKRLWELSGTLSDSEDEKMAAQIKEEGDFYRKSEQKKRVEQGQRLATVLENTDPFEGIPSDDVEDNENTTNKQSSDS